MQHMCLSFVCPEASQTQRSPGPSVTLSVGAAHRWRGQTGQLFLFGNFSLADVSQRARFKTTRTPLHRRTPIGPPMQRKRRQTSWTSRWSTACGLPRFVTVRDNLFGFCRVIHTVLCLRCGELWPNALPSANAAADSRLHFFVQECHRQVRMDAQKYIKPGMRLVDICERIENSNRRLVEENGLQVSNP